MNEIALALYLTLLAVAFGWRSWLHYRRTGNHGFRGKPQRLASLEGLAAAMIAAAAIALLVAPLASLLDLLRCLELPVWVSGLGVGIAVAGFVLVLVGQANMGASWRIGVDLAERTELVTGGLFAVVRNPVFSALGLFGLGYALMVPNALSIAGLLLGSLGLEVQVRCVEEPFLVRTHGDTYLDYGRRVGRFLPWVGRLPHA